MRDAEVGRLVMRSKSITQIATQGGGTFTQATQGGGAD